MIQKVHKYHLQILTSIGDLFSQFSSCYERKMLVKIGPRGDFIATPTTWV